MIALAFELFQLLLLVGIGWTAWIILVTIPRVIFSLARDEARLSKGPGPARNRVVPKALVGSRG